MSGNMLGRGADKASPAGRCVVASFIFSPEVKVMTDSEQRIGSGGGPNNFVVRLDDDPENLSFLARSLSLVPADEQTPTRTGAM